jgi:hypothetical protein
LGTIALYNCREPRSVSWLFDDRDMQHKAQGGYPMIRPTKANNNSDACNVTNGCGCGNWKLNRIKNGQPRLAVGQIAKLGRLA